MSTYFLLNTTKAGTEKFFAGDRIDEAVHSKATIEAAGGVLWPSVDERIAAAAAFCQLHRKKGKNESELDALMFAAAHKSLYGTTTIVVANLTVLGEMPTTDVPEGAQARVTTLGDVWVLSADSGLTIDGITVIAAQDGRRWLRQTGSVNPKWAERDDWYVSTATGNDENDGGTLDAPLKSAAEVYRRVGNYPKLTGGVANGSRFVVTINILDDLDFDDPMQMHADLGVDRLLLFKGTPEVTASGSITAVTDLNRATNQAWEITTATTLNTGARIKLKEPSPNAGNIFYVAAALGGGVYRISAPCSVASSPATTEPTMGSVDIGDTFDVERVPEAAMGDIDVRAQIDGSPRLAVTFQDLAIIQGSSRAIGMQGITVNAIWRNCRFDAPFFSVGGLRHVVLNCLGFLNAFTSADRPLYIFAGLSLNATVLAQYGELYADYDFLMQGAYILVNNFASLGTVGIFDSVEHGVYVGETDFFGGAPGARVWNRANFSSGVGHLYGSGNAGVGVYVVSGCTFAWDAGLAPGTVLPTLTGAGGDFKLANVATARAWDEAGGAYSTARACTWANINTSIAGGGFGGSAHNVQQDAHVLRLSDSN